jgi:CheY-like chemotaxis protein
MSTIASSLEFHRPDATLLCVDDNPGVLVATKMMLEEIGYGVLTAPGGREAIQVFRESRVDLVVVDYEMPGMKGHEVAVWIKSLNPRMPVVLHSGALILPDEALRATDAFVTKGGRIPSSGNVDREPAHDLQNQWRVHRPSAAQ